MRTRHALALSLALASPCIVACGGQEFVAGAGDAAPAQEAAAPDAGPGFCLSQPAGAFAFCSDFDEKPLPENWDDLLTKGSPPVAEDDATSVSPPNSLLATAPALAAGATATESFVTTTKLPTPGAVHIAFEMRIDELSFPSNATGALIVPALYTQGKYEILLAFEPSTTGPFDFVLYELSPAVVSALDAGASITRHDLTPLFAQASDGGSGLGSWQQFKIDLDIDDGKKTATVTVGSISTLVNLDVPIGTANGARSFSIGLEATAPTGEAKMHFDNVTYSAAE